MTPDQGRAAQRGAEPGDFAAERPADPACLLRPVCQACGAVARTGPPAVRPQCRAEMPGT